MHSLAKSCLIALLALIIFEATTAAQTTATPSATTPGGALTVMDAAGKPTSMCPLKHTDVKAEISGFLSRVVVTQEFDNPFKEKIEAVYTFPLPHNAAVDDMTMIVGERTIRGKILPREEAQLVYEAAKSAGKVASLLDQERPNIFTQSVANILPGERVRITISYVETLKYENGAYEFVFPMVVGPRYIPNQVPDASRITPPTFPRDMRSGHDISLDIALDAGLIIDDVSSKTHPIDLQRIDNHTARIRLKQESTIPNKDFVLRYDITGGTIQDALLAHASPKGRFFTLMLQPPERVTVEDVTPKELVFVLDTSGSMSGFPIEKAKETIRLALKNLYPSDTFNLITFAGDTRILFPQPVPATNQNLQTAQAFLKTRSGAGGTEMMTAIKAALEPSDAQEHLRIVCFMTDGFVGNDMEIIAEVQKHPNARVFAFGIGESVNRFLLDKMADAGRGEVEYVGLNDDGSAAARRFHERVRTPLLTDITIDWGGLPVEDVYPQRIPDLFGAKPVSLTGRFRSAGRGTIRLKGKIAGSDFVREISVELPDTMALHDVLASLWARQRIDSLMDQDYGGAQQQAMRADLKNAITQLGIEFRLMTQFTSFVAVEEMIVTDGGQPRRIDVPVESPEGVQSGAQFGLTPGVSMNGGFIISNVPSRARGRGGPISRGVLASSQRAMPMPPNMPATVTLSVDIPTSPEEQKAQRLRVKVHPSLLALIDRVQKKEPLLNANEIALVKDGKAEVQIWLTEKSAERLAKLKELGFEVLVDPGRSKLIIGRIPVEKLEQLAELDFVRYLSPQPK